MTNYDWQHTFRGLYDKALVKYRNEHSNIKLFFTPREVNLLLAMGVKPSEMFDFAEDSSDVDADTALLITSVRRDYFRTIQKEVWSSKAVNADQLPAKEEQLEGITWLPRITAKAYARLRGELANEVMYGCSGDRKFLRSHDIHPADFLRAVWAAKGDVQKVLAYVKSSGVSTKS